MKSHLYTALGALKVGMDILLKEEKVGVDRIYGHGGFSKLHVSDKVIWLLRSMHR